MTFSYLLLIATDDNLKICDPWQARNFSNFLELTPDGHCDYCLPDCISTIYNTQVSSAPFKPCDHSNIGASPMCQFSTKNDLNPPIWAQAVEQQYEKSEGNIPEFLDNSGIFPNERRYVAASKVDHLMLKTQVY